MSVLSMLGLRVCLRVYRVLHALLMTRVRVLCNVLALVSGFAQTWHTLGTHVCQECTIISSYPPPIHLPNYPPSILFLHFLSSSHPSPILLLSSTYYPPPIRLGRSFSVFTPWWRPACPYGCCYSHATLSTRIS